MEQGVFNVSNGERRFTRYGYADLYQEGRGYDILYRLWPGTQRHLLSADPAWAAAMGRTANFCGAAGLGNLRAADLQGPRRLRPSGRAQCLCRTRTSAQGLAQIRGELPAVGTAALQSRTPRPTAGAAASSASSATRRERRNGRLAAASRILPLLTSAHLPSASNHSLWHEMYTNQPIVDGAGLHAL